MGGDDQWSNCLAGADLVRRKHAKPAFVLTMPLLTTASGGKMGKTAGGAVWLEASRTSPYDFYQYWVNTDDRDVERFLGFFTFLPMDEVKRLGAARGADLNESKRVLAYEVTKLCHGEEQADAARSASQAAFGGGDSAAMPTFTLPTVQWQAGLSQNDLFALAFGMTKSDARRLIEQGGASVNDVANKDPKTVLSAAQFKEGALVLKAGKKRILRVLAG
jgi:tyrosyl-tRNA synthetase